jgi:hypothetical protein
MGGEFPNDYFISLIEKVKICKFNKIKFIMWVDDSSHNYNHQKFMTINGLVVKNLSELHKDMLETYGKKHFDIFINEILDFELSVNPKGYAAISDYYRVEILRQYGGLYLDTDIKIQVINNEKDPLLNINFKPVGVFGRIPESYGANCILIASDDFNAKTQAKNGFINMLNFSNKILFNSSNYQTITEQQIDLMVEKRLPLCNMKFGLRHLGATITIQSGVMCFYNSSYDRLYGETVNDLTNVETRKYYLNALVEIKKNLIDIKEKTKFAYDITNNAFDEASMCNDLNKFCLILDGSNVKFEINYDNSWLIYVKSANETFELNAGKIKQMDMFEYNGKRRSIYSSILKHLEKLSLKQFEVG